MSDKAVFDVVRAILKERTGKGLFQNEVDRINAALNQTEQTGVTERVALEVFGHEAIVREAYKDSEGVWTVFGGLTKYAGINPLDYKDKPASMEFAVSKTMERIIKKYAPEVIQAFQGRVLSEAQFAAALSFHWNTGAIGRADWVQSWLDGELTKARSEFMNWRKPSSIIERREKERDLFFNGTWTNDGMTLEYDVSKPSYTPRWSSAKRVDIRSFITKALAAYA